MTIENTIKDLLTTCCKPEVLELRNDSHKHIGHVGVNDALNSHFSLTIVSTEFRNKSRVQRHQMIYECLKELMDNPIHALAIHAYTPEERETLNQKER